MGRGRAKAKQTKVARELKYRGSGTDLDALRAELVGTHADGSLERNGASHGVLDDEDDEDASRSDDDDDDYGYRGYAADADDSYDARRGVRG